MRNTWYSIQNNLPQTKTLDIYIDNEIGEYGITARQFLNELKAHADKIINLHINSPGGSLIDAFAIYDFINLKQYKLNAYISGIAASAATVVSAAAAKTFIGEHSYFFVHNPYFDGPQRNVKGDLQKMKNDIIDIYRKKTGLPIDKLSKMMDEETLLNAQEALQYGFVDGIIGEARVAARKNVLHHLAKLPLSEQLNTKTKADTIFDRVFNTIAQLDVYIKNTINGSEPEKLDFINITLESGEEMYVLPAEQGAWDIVEGDKVYTQASIDAEPYPDGEYTQSDKSIIIIKSGIVQSIKTPKNMEPNKELEAQLQELISQLQSLLEQISGAEQAKPEEQVEKKQIEEKETEIKNLHYELAKIKARRVQTGLNHGDKDPAREENRANNGWSYISNYLSRRFN